MKQKGSKLEGNVKWNFKYYTKADSHHISYYSTIIRNMDGVLIVNMLDKDLLVWLYTVLCKIVEKNGIN